MKRLPVLALLAFVALAATGCDGCGSHEKEVRRADLEDIIWHQLKEKGKYNPSVYCPDGLDPHVGAQIVCYTPIAGRDYDVTATVTEVDERGNVTFDIEVGTEPRLRPTSYVDESDASSN